MQIIDFEGISDIAPYKFDEIFCALGTTMKQASSHEAFLRVDVDCIYAAAKWGKAAGVRRFVLVSAPGASEGSLSFYLRAKGRIERRVSELGFEDLPDRSSADNPRREIGYSPVRTACGGGF